MFEQFRNKIPLAEEKWNEYVAYFKCIDAPAKTILLKEGEISKRAFLIEKGCVRAWFNNDGKDITCQFFFENNSVASVESFKKSIPSPIMLETIEPSVLWYIHKKDLNKIIEDIKEIPELREQFINAIFERTFHYMSYFISFIKNTPTERYLNLIEKNPKLLQRVPQHFIASYLGISKVHLSRIKGTIAKK